MLHREYEVDNGGYQQKMYEFKCDNCGEIMCCSWPRIDVEEKNYCGECALIIGIIDGFQYAKSFLYFLGDAHWAEIVDGIPHAYSEKRYKAKLKREKNGKTDRRNSPEYKAFRKSVFKRDNFTCQHCQKRGSELNAHHIKPYKTHKKLRTDINNGITLCIECHKNEHREINVKKTKSRN